MKIFSIVILVPLFIACSGKTEFDESGTSEELMENEIWNPIIILSREENKIVTAKSDKLYKKSNEMVDPFSSGYLISINNSCRRR